MNRFITYIQNLGDLLIYLMKLHMFAILHILKGGLLLGFFPTLCTLIDIFQNSFANQSYTRFVFSQKWHQYFRISNQVGWLILSILIFLLYDLFLASHYLRILSLNLFLLFLILFTSSLLSWALVSVVRYQLSFFLHLKQGFFLLLASFFENIAIWFATSIILMISIGIPFLFIFLGCSLAVLPIAWFSFISTRRIESHNQGG